MGEGSPAEPEDPVVTVSTDAAEYVLHPGSHRATTELATETLRDIDGVVLESGVHPYETVTLAELEQNTQYAELVDHAVDRHMPVFLVDVPYQSSGAKTMLMETLLLGAPFLLGMYGMLHGHPGFSGLLVPALATCTGGSAASQRVNRAASYLQLSGAYTSLGFRSAMTAAKLDAFVAPHLSEQVDGKPRILVEYGAGHLDIAAYLRHPTLRKHVVRAGKRLHQHTVKTAQCQEICAFERRDAAYTKTVYEASF